MRAKRLIQILVSLALLIVLVRWIDLDGLGEAIRGADYGLLAVALVIATLNRVLMAVKWNLLLAARGIRLEWTRATRIYYTSTFLGLFLPPTVGGDVVRAWLVTRSESRLPDVVSSILVERLLGLVAIAMFGVVGAALFPMMNVGGSDLAINTGQLVMIVAAVALLSVLGMAFSFTRGCERLVESVTGRLVTWPGIGRFAKTLAKIYRSYREYRSHRGTLAAFFALTLLENALPIVRAWIVAVALHAPVPLTYFFVIVPLELVLIRIPISFDGFGIREGLFVYFLGLVGIAESLGFAVGLTNHVLFLIAVLPGGIFYLLDPAASRRRDS